MRDDMYHVIVERPRLGGRIQGDGRAWRNSRDRGSHLGMRRGYAQPKWLNENLAPLKRWLHKQVHRPWDKVYAELCEGIGQCNTVQARIHAHVGQIVARQTCSMDGEVMAAQSWPHAWVPVRTLAWVELFVHPRTGILLPNRGLNQARELQRQQRAQRRVDQPYASYHVMDANTQWHCVDGCWFEVRLAALPMGKKPVAQRYDVLRRCMVSRNHAFQSPAPGIPSQRAMYGQGFVYAESKRQLSRRELLRAPKAVRESIFQGVSTGEVP